MAAPDWYPDPHRPGMERWWDGTRWSEQTRAANGGSWGLTGEQRSARTRRASDPYKRSRRLKKALVALLVLAVLGGVGAHFREDLQTKVLRIDPVSESKKSALRVLLLTREDIPLDYGFLSVANDAEDEGPSLEEATNGCLREDADAVLFEEESDAFSREPYSIWSDVKLYRTVEAATRELSMLDNSAARECYRKAVRDAVSADGSLGVVNEVVVQVAKDPSLSLENRLLTVLIQASNKGKGAMVVFSFHFMQREGVLVTVAAAYGLPLEDADQEHPDEPFWDAAHQAALDALEGRFMGYQAK